MKNTILYFLAIFAGAILLSYFIFGKETFETRELVKLGIIVAFMTIFTPENNKKIWKRLFGPKNSADKPKV